ncbi:MAG TPA: PAS domain-containing sensor histidine kinase, partial [Polyangia bacterium]|nr:PAS domain-containing sensor histidine kinase [Polyangia bacterium]
MTSLAELLDRHQRELVRRAEALLGDAPSRRARLEQALGELRATLESGRASSGGWSRAASDAGAELLREHDALHDAAFAIAEQHAPGVPVRDLRLVSAWRDAANAAVHARREGALRDENRRYAMLLDTVEDGMVLTGPQDGGVFLYLNRAAGEAIGGAVGKTREQLIGQRMADLALPPLMRRNFDSHRAEVVSGRAHTREFFVPLPSGGKWRETRATPVFADDGTVEAVAVMSRDITERKLAEQRLQLIAKMSTLAEALEYDGVLEALARLSIPELADVCIVDVIEDGAIRRAQVAHRDPAQAALAEELKRCSPEAGYRTLAGAELLAGRSVLLEDADGELRELDARSLLAVPFVVLGKTVAVATFIMTGGSERRYRADDRAIAEELARRAAHILENARLHRELRAALAQSNETLAFRERVMGVLGHDLRNPLSAVLGIVTLAQLDGNLPQAQRRHLEQIEGAARRMFELIGAMLDFTQTRFAGKLPLQTAPSDLRELSARVVAELTAAHRGRTIDLESQGDARGEWDAGRVAQVVSNLVANALEHGEARAPVRVTVEGDGADVWLKVHNRGPAIAAELQPVMFEPFRRGAR